jgi:hypothetical protein
MGAKVVVHSSGQTRATRKAVVPSELDLLLPGVSEEDFPEEIMPLVVQHTAPQTWLVLRLVCRAGRQWVNATPYPPVREEVDPLLAFRARWQWAKAARRSDSLLRELACCPDNPALSRDLGYGEACYNYYAVPHGPWEVLPYPTVRDLLSRAHGMVSIRVEQRKQRYCVDLRSPVSHGPNLPFSWEGTTEETLALLQRLIYYFPRGRIHYWKDQPV